MAGGKVKYNPKFVDIVRKMCELGAIDTEIQEALGIVSSTFYKWKHDYPEFADALKIGKEKADDRVEQTLYKRAIGYTQTNRKVFNNNGEEMIVEYEEVVNPDTTACFFWLKNRKPEQWADKKQIDHTSAGKQINQWSVLPVTTAKDE